MCSISRQRITAMPSPSWTRSTTTASPRWYATWPSSGSLSSQPRAGRLSCQPLRRRRRAAATQVTRCRPGGSSTPPVPQHVPRTTPIAARPHKGDCAFVPSSLWPDYACDEHWGTGWEVTVVTSTKFSAVVHYTHAVVATGQPWADDRLDWMVLHSFREES